MLAERVADARAMTPTEAGAMVTPSITDELETLARIEQRLTAAYQTLVDERLTDLDRQIETGVDHLQHCIRRQAALQSRAADLEHRVETAYRTVVEHRLDTIEAQIDEEVQAIAFETQEDRATKRAARRRLADLEMRIETAYQTQIDQQLDDLDRRIADAYRDVETKDQLASETAAVRRLRAAVLVLIALLAVAGAVLLMLLL